jgi:hypothetical protein
MTTPLKQIFDQASTQIKFDLTLSKRIQRYVGDLMNRNEDTVMFFGSNLTGTYDLRYKTSDRNEWFVDIKDLDEYEIRKRVTTESSLDPNWVRANDVFNLDCLYTIHRYLNSSLNQKQMETAVEAVAMALNIKLLGSIMAAYFPYKCDERIAQEVYARLSRKFYIKKFGNWRAVLEKRSHDIAFNNSKWYPILKEFTDDEQIAQCISDIQGRLRSMIKYVWGVLEEVKADDAKFRRTSSTIEIEGEKVLQTLKRDTDKYLRYSQEIVLDRNTFIKPEVLAVVEAEMRTLSAKLLVDALNEVVVIANSRSKQVEELVEASVQHAINTIQSDRAAARYLSDISWLLNKEKLLFMASKTNDPLVFKARTIAEDIVKKACRTKNATMVAALKTGVIIYIIGRTFTHDYYQK